MFLPKFAHLYSLKQHAHGLLKDLLDQIVLILIVAIERCPAHHRSLGQVADGEGIKPLFFDQSNEGFSQQDFRALHTQIVGFVSHFSLRVSFATDSAD